MEFIFALRTFREYTLPLQPFYPPTYHHALRYDFGEKEVHDGLARLLELLFHNAFQVVYFLGTENGVADFLLWQARYVVDFRLEEDYGRFSLVTLTSDRDLEPLLVEDRCDLSGEEIGEKDSNHFHCIRKASKSVIAWNDERLRRITLRPMLFLWRYIPTKGLETLDDRIGD